MIKIASVPEFKTNLCTKVIENPDNLSTIQWFSLVLPHIICCLLFVFSVHHGFMLSQLIGL
jgi:hypothetical protein